MFTQVTARCMCNLESEWPAYNQGKTLGWLAREKTQYKNYSVYRYVCMYVYMLLHKNREHKIGIIEMKLITKL